MFVDEYGLAVRYFNFLYFNSLLHDYLGKVTFPFTYKFNYQRSLKIFKILQIIYSALLSCWLARGYNFFFSLK